MTATDLDGWTFDDLNVVEPGTVTWFSDSNSTDTVFDMASITKQGLSIPNPSRTGFHDKTSFTATFDSDIDIFDERDVFLGIATRSQWHKDVIICPDLRGSELDPSVIGALTTKGGIDCTKPVGEGYAERNKIDESIWEEVQVEDFISPERLARIATERM